MSVLDFPKNKAQTPHRRPINLTTSFKLIVTPLKTTTEQRICVMWMGHQNPQQRDWIGLVPKGQRNRFAVGHTFLNGHVFGMGTSLTEEHISHADYP